MPRSWPTRFIRFSVAVVVCGGFPRGSRGQRGSSVSPLPLLSAAVSAVHPLGVAVAIRAAVQPTWAPLPCKRGPPESGSSARRCRGYSQRCGHRGPSGSSAGFCLFAFDISNDVAISSSSTRRDRFHRSRRRDTMVPRVQKAPTTSAVVGAIQAERDRAVVSRDAATAALPSPAAADADGPRFVYDSRGLVQVTPPAEGADATQRAEHSRTQLDSWEDIAPPRALFPPRRGEGLPTTEAMTARADDVETDCEAPPLRIQRMTSLLRSQGAWMTA